MAPGPTELPLYAVSLISAIALVTDLRSGRIFNWLTLPALVLGLLAQPLLGGWSAFLGGLGGALLGLVLFGWLFALRAMGGGDVKLLMAVGAWTDPRTTAEVALLAILLGGLFGLVAMIFTGRIKDFARRMARFLLTVFIRELEVEAPKVDPKFTMAFGVPLAIAAVWVVAAHPLQRWGLTLW